MRARCCRTMAEMPAWHRPSHAPGWEWGGCYSGGESRKKDPTLLPGYDQDTHFLPTIVLRRAGRVLPQ